MKNFVKTSLELKNRQSFGGTIFEKSKDKYAQSKEKILSLHKKLGMNLWYINSLVSEEKKEALSF